MCGVCGIVSYDGPPDLALLRRMMGRLGHRGPDGNGYFRDRHAALGHTRLAIGAGRADHGGRVEPGVQPDDDCSGTAAVPGGEAAESAAVKISAVLSDMDGVTGRDIMDHLIAGERDPKVLAQLARRQARAKIPRLEEALEGADFFTEPTSGC